MEDCQLALDAFVRSVGVSKASPYAFFLGAGCSVSSGVPSAWRCTLEWKREIFLSNNIGLRQQFSELSLPSVQGKIQHWLDTHGFPQKLRQWMQRHGLNGPAGAHEYGFYIEQCFPIADDRRRYFQNTIERVRPHIGYKLLCLLARAGVVTGVWTTNFDGLVAKAGPDAGVTPIEIGVDSQQRIDRIFRQGELLCVALHGDYRYDLLKNTPAELRKQEAALEAALVKRLGNNHLIVCGYSGRDQSVMDALTKAYAERGTGNLYWCGHGQGSPPDAVQALLRTARKHGRTAYYVTAEGFDDLVHSLAEQCLTGSDLADARGVISATPSDPMGERAAFAITEYPIGSVIKSNAFPMECPSDVLAFEIKDLPAEGVWDHITEIAAGMDFVAVPFGGKVLALGTTDAARDTFGERLQGTIIRTPINNRDLRYEDGAIVSLLVRALVRCCAKKFGFGTDGEKIIWDPSQGEMKQADGKECRMVPSLVLALRLVEDKPHLVLKPSVVFLDEAGNILPAESTRNQKLATLSNQYNQRYNEVLNAWREKLFAGNKVTWEYPPDCGSTFRFHIHYVPLCARIGDPLIRTSPIKLDTNLQRAASQRGIILADPSLRFSARGFQGVTAPDPHPIRGLLNNKPFDYAMTTTGLADRITVGVVCPEREAARFEAFFQGLLQRESPEEKERDYLLDFPGFHTAFGLPLVLPAIAGASWVRPVEPEDGVVGKDGTLELARKIIRAIDGLHAASAPHVVFVCTPARWSGLRRYETEEEQIDLHDHIKAYCVKKGIATQFLDEETIEDRYQCRIRWWLSLALYVKSLRTPWILDTLDSESAYVGLGYSQDRKAKRGEHILMGCSHIYSASGEGLQYRLTQLREPIRRYGKPFMSKEDARRAGEGIRELFYAARMELPRRVVIHKRTPFIADEREGLLQGLSGVKVIDMIEINMDAAFHYLASTPTKDAGLQGDTFPVKRGTVVGLEKYTALLWNHGAVPALNPHRRHFQGKRRIPTPLLVRRHVGKTPLEVIAREILGLSKMNWNSFDLYSKFPATIQSSNEIARIGALLEGYPATPFDYRLFI